MNNDTKPEDKMSPKASLNPIFSNNLVLQANKPVRIFGTGTGHITVSIAGMTKSVVSDASDWVIEFDPVDYGGPYVLSAELNGEKKEVTNVCFGDVILVAGQSNMQFKLSESSYPENRYEDNEKTNLFVIDRLEKNEPYSSSDGWTQCRRENAGNWSALGYHIAQNLNKASGHTVGIIACYQGASVIQSWIKEEYLYDCGLHIPYEDRRGDAVCEEYSSWNGDGVLYREMFLSIVPFSLKAVVWYQGESNVFGYDGCKDFYLKLLKALISLWRKDLCDEALPFVVVQIADFDFTSPDSHWHDVQQAQLELPNEVPYTSTVVCRDICESDCIHPPTKDALGKRIADTVRDM